MKKHEWKKFLSYYKPYKKIFAADMLFACMGAAVTLIIPLIIRYITSDVIYRDSSQSLHRILVLTGIMALLVLLECYCNYFRLPPEDWETAQSLCLSHIRNLDSLPACVPHQSLHIISLPVSLL